MSKKSLKIKFLIHLNRFTKDYLLEHSYLIEHYSNLLRPDERASFEETIEFLIYGHR